jgi:hypothetical protein
MSQLVDDLSRLAVVGTQGQGIAELSNHAVDRLVAKLTPTSPAEQTLLRAGTWNINQRAGRSPAPATFDFAWACETDERTECSTGVTRIVEELFHGVHNRPLLAEVFRLLATSELRVPDRLLPDCLNQKDLDVRQAARETLGPRARWLAALRQDWRWVLQSPRARTAPRQKSEPTDQQREAQIHELLKTKTPWSPDVVLSLENLASPWGEATSRHILDAIHDKLIAAPHVADLDAIGKCLRLVARAVSPLVFHDALRPWTWSTSVEPVLAVSLERWWKEFRHTVQLRQQIHQELSL